MNTNYAGIDYGLGKSNVNKETGIRFGVIPQNALNPDAADDIWQNGTDLVVAPSIPHVTGSGLCPPESCVLHDGLRGKIYTPPPFAR